MCVCKVPHQGYGAGELIGRFVWGQIHVKDPRPPQLSILDHAVIKSGWLECDECFWGVSHPAVFIRDMSGYCNTATGFGHVGLVNAVCSEILNKVP